MINQLLDELFIYCLLTKSVNSTSNRLDIFTRVSRSGCEELVHHFETVDGLTLSCSHSHL